MTHEARKTRRSKPSRRPVTRVLALALLLFLAGCSGLPTSRTALAERSLKSTIENRSEVFREAMLTIDSLSQHCSVAVVSRARQSLPYRYGLLKGAIGRCHKLAPWKRAQLLGIQGGDVSEKPRECGGHFERLSDVVVTYVVAQTRYQIHLRKVYRRGGRYLVVGQPPS